MKRRADGRWLKVKKIDGEPVYFYSTASTEKAAIKDIEQQMLEYSQQKHKDKHNFKLLADKMLKFQELSVSYNTLECYTHALKHLKPFYSYNIEDITPAMVQKILDDMVQKENYSFSAVTKTKVVFGLVMGYAIVQENIPLNNYTRSLKIPKNAHKGKVTAPPKDVTKIIINNADKVEFGMWAMVFLCTGLRRGEQAALRRRDVDFEKNEIYVSDAVEFIVNQPHLKGKPKTEASIDSVPILGILRPHLEKLCEGLHPDEFLFGRDKPLTKTQIDKRLKKYCDTIGYHFTGHQLRHAFARMIYEAGIDVKTAQRLLRHADFSTTMNIYTEFTNEMTNKSVNMLDAFTSNLVNN